MVYRNPVYHQIIFASLIIITALRITYILQLSDASHRIPAKARKAIIHFFSTGAALFALGFLIWNVDNIFCYTLTMWKVNIGWPVAFLLEGEFLLSLRMLFFLKKVAFGNRSLLVACFNCASTVNGLSRSNEIMVGCWRLL
jgi:Ceramidase